MTIGAWQRCPSGRIGPSASAIGGAGTETATETGIGTEPGNARPAPLRLRHHAVAPSLIRRDQPWMIDRSAASPSVSAAGPGWRMIGDLIS